MKKICLILSILFVSILVSCGGEKEDNTSQLSDDKSTKSEETKDKNTESDVGEKNVSGEMEIPIKIVNSSSEPCVIWVGDSEDIVKENEIDAGGLRDEKLKLKVKDNLLATTIKLSSAKDDEIIESKSIEVNGEYKKEKPVVVMWDNSASEFTVTY